MAQGIDPIHQFQLHDLAGPWNIAGHEISFTNSALFMGISVGLITLILLAAAARGALVPGRLQSVGEMWYEFVHNMVHNVLGHEGRPSSRWSSPSSPSCCSPTCLACSPISSP